MTIKNIPKYHFGSGSILELAQLIGENFTSSKSGKLIAFVDEYFCDDDRLMSALPKNTSIRFVATKVEPTTELVDSLVKEINEDLGLCNVELILGIGGGATMDVAKAVSNLANNPGNASKYQGWDLLKAPGIPKIGIPTLFGTGAEATRTCVLTDKTTNKKLGMNSDFSLFDMVVIDPDLCVSVDRNQYFYTGMDCYIHCIEALSGGHRSPIGDAYSREALNLCREVFFSDDMMGSTERQKLAIASYLGGCAIATSFVGLVHPFSAGLSVALGTRHCIGNCIALTAMEEFYSVPHAEFTKMVDRNDIEIPRGITSSLTDADFDRLYNATIIHDKPLVNALGAEFKSELTPLRVRSIFERM